LTNRNGRERKNKKCDAHDYKNKAGSSTTVKNNIDQQCDNAQRT
jgi:hypothetical protein